MYILTFVNMYSFSLNKIIIIIINVKNQVRHTVHTVQGGGCDSTTANAASPRTFSNYSNS